MRRLRGPALLVAVGVLSLAGCGGNDAGEQPRADEASSPATEPVDEPMGEDDEAESGETGTNLQSSRDRAAAAARRPPGTEGLRMPATRAEIVARRSPFGRVLFDANGQVVYVFENDRANRSNCTSAECVTAWPPVLTRERPSAGAGARSGLLGTIRRADGGLQVTYNGRPLYFYEHEGRGEIKCHNVELHGGLWWVVTAGGDPAV